jgi:integrase
MERKARRKETRRRNRKGTGSCFQRSDGRWEGRLSIEDGGAIYVYGKTEKEVRAKLFAEQRAPRIREPEGLSMSEWLDRWLGIARPGLRLNTYVSYRSAIENHIKPHLGKLKLSRVKQTDIYDMLDALRAAKVGSSAREKAYRTLRAAMQTALKRQMVASNVVTLVDKPKCPTRQKVILQSAKEVKRFRDAARSSRFAALYLTALDTGARSGELRALTWKNVDFNNGTIRIEATLNPNGKGELVALPPKTASSNRTIKLTAANLQLLREHEKQQMASERGLSTWVFPNLDGGPLRRDAMLSKDWANVVLAARIPGLSLHGLRHTHATMLAEAAVPVQIIMARLGHSSSKMTMEVYAHATTQMQDQAVQALGALYDKIDSQIDSQTEQEDSTETRKALSDAG